MDTQPTAHPAQQGELIRPALQVVPITAEPTVTQLGIIRRLRLALYDLGLLDIVGPDWVRPAGRGFAVGDLSLRAVDALLRRLEQLASESGHRNVSGSSNYLSDDPAIPPPVDSDEYTQGRLF